MSFQKALPKLENTPNSIRNVCILAHIDHGKTSLSDCMLASNGLISQHHQGEIRYLDSRSDEQERGITMEASAIALYAKTIDQEFVINLIDSPGHVDFSSEVTQTSRLCDSAIILVDALEGVCSQTVSALKQAWDEELQAVLVVNKIDKLYDEWQLTATEAAEQLSKVIEQVNAVWGQLYIGRRMETEKDDDITYFSPSENNVVFCSALHGWGFTIKQFANIFEKKLGVDRTKLAKFLWGDFHLDPKTKKVISGGTTSASSGKVRKSLFAQFIIENIWAVYEASNAYDTDKVAKIVSALNLKPVKDVSDPKQIFHQWIPLFRAIYATVIALPSPIQAQKTRLDCILRNTPHVELVDSALKKSMGDADPKGSPLAYVSKVVSVDRADIPAQPVDLTAAQFEQLKEQIDWIPTTTSSYNSVVLGFARIYSGTFRVGMKFDLLEPRYDPAIPQELRRPVQITGIFLFMGKNLISVSQAGPGALVGISGLEGTIVKSATLCETGSGIVAPNLARSAQVAAPILRVAIEPKDPTKLDDLEEGLNLLNVADPSVEFQISKAGEFILATAGELHLERCLHDLADRYAQVDMDVSPPVVPFRETIKSPFTGSGPVNVDVGQCHMQVQVRPLKESDKEELKSMITAVIIDNLLVDETPSQAIKTMKLAAQSILAGFKAAMSQGPLLNEPVQGVVVSIISLDKSSPDSDVIGQRRLISATKKAILDAMELWSPRVVLAMYRCEIQASTEVLGKVYAVINGRRGRVLVEELKEGTPFFLIKALIPVVESIGFSEEIRTRTSGAANPQLMFDSYEVLDEDPYWVPSTEEELEELGETADRENIALNYTKQIRRRKGLFVGDKLVEGAERDRSHRH